MFNTSRSTIQDFLAIYKQAVRGQGDQYADVRDGSVYEQPGGVAAMIWSREAQRDEDLFRAVYFNTAEGEQLTDLVYAKDGISRILDAPGVGVATFVRPNASAGGGTIWAGTRIAVLSSDGLSVATYYEVAQDISITTQLIAQLVPIKATFNGPGSKVYASTGTGASAYPRLDDALWDSTWTVTNLSCEDGTVFEPAKDFRTRVKQARLDKRVGYVTSITNVAKAAGAAQIALFSSNYGGDDSDAGLNVCYVGDTGFNSSTSLVNNVMLALEGVRVLGDNLQVLPMTTANLTVTATVQLKVAPYLVNTTRIGERIANKLVQYLGKGFAYSTAEMTGAMFKASHEIQDAIITVPSSDIGILVGGSFPAVLTKYNLNPNDVHLTFTGPA